VVSSAGIAADEDAWERFAEAIAELELAGGELVMGVNVFRMRDNRLQTVWCASQEDRRALLSALSQVSAELPRP
jgi:hypothetical protein